MPLNFHIPIKPLSVNSAWQGKRFKTPAYKEYERVVLLSLPAVTLPEPPYKISFVFGVSNMQSDVDNPVKMLIDIMSKKYGFNDAHVHEINAKKVKVSKGKEYSFISFEGITAFKL